MIIATTGEASARMRAGVYWEIPEKLDVMLRISFRMLTITVHQQLKPVNICVYMFAAIT